MKPAILEPTAIAGQRVESDYYPTPAPITEILLNTVPAIAGSVVFEPCCGLGAISEVLRSANCVVYESDILIQDDQNRDATTPSFWEWHCPQWVVTNPPFNVAEEILPHAFEAATLGVAFLLRLTYLEPTQGRAQWLREHADHLRFVVPVSPRPQFRRDARGTDSCTCAWFVWDKAWSWRSRGIECPFVFATGWRSRP